MGSDNLPDHLRNLSGFHILKPLIGQFIQNPYLHLMPPLYGQGVFGQGLPGMVEYNGLDGNLCTLGQDKSPWFKASQPSVP